ncbi:caspase family protein [Glaciecola sp. 2405UD65-10]|uniref:caspase family protein n=1 Tax=Glaciecola sp. 2405UD65-10 TaxID=3397244 RepID=UPI003B592988
MKTFINTARHNEASLQTPQALDFAHRSWLSGLLKRATFMNKKLVFPKYVLMILAVVFSVSSIAADKALIIGIEEYKNPRLNLKGIGLDVGYVQQALARLGVEQKNVITLFNENATEANITRMFNTFLRDGVGPNDKVYVYFSGHGSQMTDTSGDESDRLDEFLVTYEFDHRGNKPGALTDDEFNKLLTSIPSNNVFAFVDACHSGTISRSFVNNNLSMGENIAYPKFATYPGMPQVSDSAKSRSSRRSVSMDDSQEKTGTSNRLNYIVISAAQDDESALASPKGSYFTLGFTYGIEKMLNEQKPVTPEVLYTISKAVIDKFTNQENHYTPNIMGNKALLKETLKTQAPGKRGKVWQEMAALVPANPGLTIQTPKLNYKVDEAVPLSVNVPANGYLYLFTVDQYDNSSILFPNEFNANNKVSAGQNFDVNYASVGFDLLGAEPLGEAIVVAVVSSRPLNTKNKSPFNHDEQGNRLSPFEPVSPGMARAIKIGKANITENQASSNYSYYAGKVVFNVLK